ncbi:phage antirepressor KilAC domain-containing protein [Vibrio anguillarum]|uniref:DNA-binding protein n=11 Tax=Vibrio anguillarum TaxID=55601 RepID=A0AAW4AW73_VIBAN|nr:phage antirepressor KilAC domain-containing protein [Vibrio anguillarum]AOT26637.1 putative DNA-binding protein Roi [Vibrio phage pVa-2]AOT26728.1 putative DNA-binding protein Roi [Vibrio phage pVa-1]AOT26910.1 putative DNA-binding protein Roi [Vibrio phage pVa-6]ARB13217.1 putative DNA-binding protein Roi [Vibrio phage P3]ARB13307.1 putative DNA-binding protein Roi [Vibrio phage pVa-3]ARH11823.1 putative DNA-binding protein Roi [Vibrio phage pVa-4]QCW19472.1 DNA-binding protein [Vibrio p
MFELSTQKITMSSREIAELTQSRHDNVKRSMERMLSNCVISFTPMEEPTIGGGKPTTVYHVNKRDSYIVVAQLSPEFTAALVDRWQELESANQFRIPQTLPEALQLAADLAKQNEEVTKQLAIAAPKVEFAEAIASTKRGVLLGQFAKVIGLGPVTIFKILRELRILISEGKSFNLPYQNYIDSGYFTVTQRPFVAGDETRISNTTVITGKGEIWLRKKLLDKGYLRVVAK